MKTGIYTAFYILIGTLICLPVSADPFQVSPGDILSTAFTDDQLKNMEALYQYISNAPRSTPYLDKIELRTETEDFDPDKQKFSVRFYPKGWGETGSASYLREIRNASRELACAEQLHKTLKNRYDLIIDYIETARLLTIEADLLANLEDQVRVLRALGPGDLSFDVTRLIDTQDDHMSHQLKQVKLENRMTGLEHQIRQLTRCGEHFRVTADTLVSVENIKTFLAKELQPDDLSDKGANNLTDTEQSRYPFLAERQIREQLAEAEYNLEIAKNRNYFSFFDVSYDIDDHDDTKEAVSLEVAIRLPFIQKDRDDILKRRIKWMETQNRVSEAEQKWLEKRISNQRQLLRFLDQYDVLTARKQTGGAATSYAVYRQMDGVNPLELLKIRESMLKTDLRLQETRFSIIRRFVDLLDVYGKLSARPLINYLSESRETIR